MRVMAMSVVLVLGLVCGAWAETKPATLSVTGEGQVAIVPDMAVISLGVVHRDSTAKVAMDKVSADAQALIAALTELQIDARDIQTDQLSVNPVYQGDYNQGRKIVGFEARNSVSIRVRNLDGLGGVLDAALSAGSNTFNGLRFTLQDARTAEAEARASAVRDAMARAAQMAEAAGLSVGAILSMSEAGSGPRPEMFAAAARSADIPVSAGELTVTARVSMSFALSD